MPEMNEITSVSPGDLGQVRAETVIYKKGYSPYIDPTTLTWWEYDETTHGFIDTEVEAVGNADVLLEEVEDLSDDVLDLKNYSRMTSGSDINFVPYPYADGGVRTSYVNNGITYTVNDDGSVTANGTATANSYFYLAKNASPISLELNTKYVLKGCPEGGNASTTYCLVTMVASNNNVTSRDTGEGIAFTPSTQEAATRALRIIIYNGYTANNLTFYPMICKWAGPNTPSYVSPCTSKDYDSRYEITFLDNYVHDEMDLSQKSLINAIEAITGNRPIPLEHRGVISIGALESVVDVENRDIRSSFYRFVSEVIPVQMGDRFVAKLYGGSGAARCRAILDSNYCVLRRSDAGVTIDGALEVTDANAAYMVVNTSVEYGDQFLYKRITTPVTSSVYIGSPAPNDYEEEGE